MKHHLTTRRFLLLCALLLCSLALVVGGGVKTRAATTYGFPCAGYSVVGYGYGQYVSGTGYHVGEDVCGRAGVPVYSVADGVVVYSAKTPDSYRWGNLIMIQYANPDGSQVTGVYGHLSADRRVSPGQNVSRGQLIGFTGPAFTAENGNWDAHLHFEFHLGQYGAAWGTYAPSIVGYAPANRLGEFANPTNYINARQTEPTKYDYEIVSVAGQGNHGKNAQYDVTFTLRNTGNTAWRAGGATPMRLGTNAPRDRGSSFSAGMGGQGWLYPNRIALPSDVSPGGTVSITAKFNNAGTAPGVYVEQFTPVIEGVGWLNDKGLAAWVGVNQPSNIAQWVSQSTQTTISPTDLGTPFDTRYAVPGEKINAKIFIRNAGDETWNGGGNNPLRLGTSNSRDRASSFSTNGLFPASENWLAPHRASGLDGRYENGTVVPANTIEPGQVAVFSFTLTIPDIAPGTYNEYFTPLIEGKTWLNDMGIYIPIRVLPKGYHYEYSSQENPAAVVFAKGSASTSVLIKNAGQTAWPVGGNVRLGTDRTRDRTSGFATSDWVNPWRPSTIDVNATHPGKQSVDPGEVAKFSFTVASPSTPDGTYLEYVRPVVEGVTWMPEDYGISLPVVVKSPALDYQFVDQRFSTNVRDLHYGEKFTTTLVLRNVGSTTWKSNGDTPVRLGTSRPLDRGSGFNLIGVQDGWIYPNRVTAVDGKYNGVSIQGVGDAQLELKQGEIGVFTAEMSTPTVNPGPYNEYFNLVQENVSWFPDYGIYFPFWVVGP